VSSISLNHVHSELQCPVHHWITCTVSYSVRYITESRAQPVTVSGISLNHVHSHLHCPIYHWITCIVTVSSISLNHVHSQLVSSISLNHVHSQLQCPVHHWITCTVSYSVQDITESRAQWVSVRYITESRAQSVTVSGVSLNHVHSQCPVCHCIFILSFVPPPDFVLSLCVFYCVIYTAVTVVLRSRIFGCTSCLRLYGMSEDEGENVLPLSLHPITCNYLNAFIFCFCEIHWNYVVLSLCRSL
jgi:hypothetical protein